MSALLLADLLLETFAQQFVHFAQELCQQVRFVFLHLVAICRCICPNANPAHALIHAQEDRNYFRGLQKNAPFLASLLREKLLCFLGFLRFPCVLTQKHEIFYRYL